jgi:predicted RNase H-like nuclease
MRLAPLPTPWRTAAMRRDRLRRAPRFWWSEGNGQPNRRGYSYRNRQLCRDTLLYRESQRFLHGDTEQDQGYIFTPASQAVTVNGANVTANFSSAVQTYTITVPTPEPVERTQWQPDRRSDSDGYCQLFSSVGLHWLPNGNYIVTPIKSGYIFIPSSRSTTINSSNVTGLNFASS